MNKMVSKSRWMIWGALAAFSLFIVPVSEVAWAKAEGGSLVGFVYAQDLKTPVVGAVVKVRNIANQKEFASGTTDANGMYKIDGVDEGRYVLGVTATQGDFNFDYVMLLKGGEMAKLSVALAPGGQTTGKDAPKKSFFKSPIGIITMVAVAGALLFVIFHEGEASPIR
ncbi:MAG: carboxypeptidase regulatory-like domain-containing protein [Planctomycetes bacterium]|nr:carboxypeptidase regulatory-like domain-containing protein [Planctomycetota bacterium]